LKKQEQNMRAGAARRYRPRPSPATDARMLRTREALRRALLELLEGQQLEQITIRDIAGRAGIGYATFFRHHASKEELLNEIAAAEVTRLMALTMPLLDASNTLVSCLALCRYVGEHRATWSALLTGGGSASLRAEFIRLASTGTEWVRSSGWLPVELGAVYGVAATVEILGWWLRRPAGEMSTEAIAEILDRLVVGPAVGTLAAKPGRKA
jgi:AcrR family transcriptional regulator